MKKRSKFWSLIPALLLWAMFSVLLWGSVFVRVTDAPRENKITLYADAQVPDGTALSVALEEAKADGIGVCNVYPGGVDTNFRAKANPNYLRPETVARMIKTCMENEDGCVHDIVIRPTIEDNIP